MTSAESQPAPEPVYDVFISYSRRDGAFAEALYKALSSYVPPASLGLPQRRLRVFLDRSDFTGVSYRDAVRRHLESSAKLLLLCSPHAHGNPRYIDEEIEIFVRARGAGHVIPVLLAGIPNNEAVAGQEAERAFPPALCAAVEIPLARDFRDFNPRQHRVDRGLFERSWYFVLADIYSKSRAEIEQRDHHRRLRNQRRLLAGAGILIAVLTTLTVVALVERRAAVANEQLAQARQEEAERQTNLAVEQRKIADIQRNLAVASEKKAEERRLEADRQRRSAVDRLIRLHLASARRALETGDVPGVILWYTEALRLRPEERSHQVRLASLLGSYPRLVRVFTAAQPACELSPEGERLLCAEGDRSARLWQVATGRPVTPPLTHRGAVTQVSFSPDGRRLLTASVDGAARIWNAATGRALATLPHGPPLNHAGFSPRGDRVFTAAEDGSLRVWDAATGRALAPPMPSKPPLRDCRFSPDGTRLATLSNQQTLFPTLTVWDAATGQPAGPPLQRPVRGFAYSFRDGDRLVYTRYQDLDHALQILDALTNEPLTPPISLPAGIEHAAFSSDGRLLLVNGTDHTVSVWDARSGQPVAKMKHGPIVEWAELSPDGRYLFAIDYNHKLHLWDVQAGKELGASLEDADLASWAASGERFAVIGGGNAGPSTVQVRSVAASLSPIPAMRQGERIHSATLSPDGRYLLVTGSAVWLWRLEQGAFRAAPIPPNEHLYAAAFTRDGRPVLAVGGGAALRVRDARTGRPLTAPMRLVADVDSAELSADARYLATQSFSEGGPGERRSAALQPYLQLWDAATGLAATPPFAGVRITAGVPLAPDGRQLLLVTDGGLVRIWDLAKRRFTAQRQFNPNQIRRVAFTSQGPCVAITRDARTVEIWNVASAKPVGPALRHGAKVDSVAIGPDCGHAATIDDDDELRIWDTRTARSVTPRRQDRDQFTTFNQAVFSPDGRWLATAANDATMRLWSVATGEPRTPPMGPLEFGKAELSRDGRNLLAVDDQTGAARVWDAASGDLVAEITPPPFTSDHKVKLALSPDGRHLLVALHGYTKDLYSTELMTRIWDLSPESRPAAELSLLTQLMAGRRIDASGTFVSLTAAELRSLQEALEKRR